MVEVMENNINETPEQLIKVIGYCDNCAGFKKDLILSKYKKHNEIECSLGNKSDLLVAF